MDNKDWLKLIEEYGAEPPRPDIILVSAAQYKKMQELPGGPCLANYLKIHGLK